MGDTPGFPHPAYAAHVLQPAYQQATTHLFRPMMAAHRAHAVMLAGKGIITHENARQLLLAIEEIDEAGIAGLDYREGIEDLFFLVEGRIIEIAGAASGGNLQLARSRNDLGHALARLALRQNLLALNHRLLDLRRTVLAQARQHLETLMPGYTHTQPAQPTTMAHYLAGVLSFLGRDTQRLHAAYQTTNQSPLGAAAFTGTGFPIDRQQVADLLGFSGVMLSSHDSIGASDHQTDIASALTSLGVNLSRMTKDMLFWATHESGAIAIDDSFIQISSIMPQKRNPVVLEHLRARLSRLMGLAHTVVIQCHNIPYGDTQDIEDEIEPTLFGAIATADHILELYDAVIATFRLNKTHLKVQAGAGFATVTELADALVREHRLPFRTSHAIVSRLVQQALARGLEPGDLTADMVASVAEPLLDRRLNITDEFVRGALDPEHFVRARTTVGGSAPEATAAVLTTLAEQLSADAAWHQAETVRLQQADTTLEEATTRLLASSEP